MSGLARHVRVASVMLFAAAWGCSSSSPTPDGGTTGTPITISGLVVLSRPPAPPVPIPGVTVSVIDPLDSPPRKTQTDSHGAFTLSGAAINSSGKVRLFINGLTGVGGP